MLIFQFYFYLSKFIRESSLQIDITKIKNLFGNNLIFNNPMNSFSPATFYGKQIFLNLKKKFSENQIIANQSGIGKKQTLIHKIYLGSILMNNYINKINLLCTFIPCQKNYFHMEDHPDYKFNASICKDYGIFKRNEKEFFNFWKNRFFSDFLWFNTLYRIYMYEFGIVFFQDLEKAQNLYEVKSELFITFFTFRLLMPIFYIFYFSFKVFKKKIDTFYNPLSFKHCFGLLFFFFCFDLLLVLLYFYGKDLDECFNFKHCLLTFIGQIFISVMFILEIFFVACIGLHLRGFLKSSSSEISKIIVYSLKFFHASDLIRNLLGCILWCTNFYPFERVSLHSLIFIILTLALYLIANGYIIKVLYLNSKEYIYMDLNLLHLKFIFLSIILYFFSIGCEEHAKLLYGFVSSNFYISVVFSMVFLPFSILRNFVLSEQDIDQEKRLYKYFYRKRIEYL